MYLLPKIHKNIIPPPGRPVISSNGSPTERISQFVDFFLQPYVSSSRSYIKDTNDFLLKLQELGKLPENSILFSLDVVSLYTNIPTEMGIKCIEDFLSDHRSPDAKPSNEMLIKLLEFILTCNDFEFNNEYFLQMFGTAIGTKVAPSYANLVVATFEKLYVYKYEKQPMCWYRFIDDIFGIWTFGLESLKEFVDYLNKQVESLKFTLEHSTTQLSFLDVMVLKRNNGVICTDLFRKPTDARNYLHYSSAHPKSCKNGIPYSQFLRIRRICSEYEFFEKNAIEMAKSFIVRGYPAYLIEESMIRASRQDRKSLLLPKEQPPETERKTFDSLFLITSYSPGKNILGNIVRNCAPYLIKNPQYRALQNLDIKPVFRRLKNLKDLLVRSKVPNPNECKGVVTKRRCTNPLKCRYCPKIDKSGSITSTTYGRSYKTKVNVDCQSSNLIYAITCSRCSKQYVGQTGRRIMDRFQGHFGTISRKEINTLITDHFNNADHIGIEDIKIQVLDYIFLDSKNKKAIDLRLKIESAWIHRLGSSFPDGLNYLE